MGSTNTETVCMKRLIREVAPNAFEKCFEDRSVLNWAESVQSDIVRAAMYLTELTAIKLKVPPQHKQHQAAV
jgi:hypothetical protein